MSIYTIKERAVYSGCGCDVAEGFDYCPECRIRELEAKLDMAQARERLLKEQLQDAEELIAILAGCVNCYYIEWGHKKIAEHEEYNAKWNREQGNER